MMNILRTRTISIAVALIFQMGTVVWALQPGPSEKVEATDPNAAVISVSVSVPSYVGDSGAPLPKLTITTNGAVATEQRISVSSSHPGIVGQSGGVADFTPQKSGLSSFSFDLKPQIVTAETRVTITAKIIGHGDAKTAMLIVKPPAPIQKVGTTVVPQMRDPLPNRRPEPYKPK